VNARRIRIGARSSKLSQAQTFMVLALLKESFGARLTMEVVHVKTLGDRTPPSRRKANLSQAGAKGAFTGEIETMLLEGEIDIAVHSMKDLTSELTRGLTIGATPPRSDPRDALISNDGGNFDSLPKGAKVGTSSLRRKAQLLKLRRDVDVVDLHGNVDTRLQKVMSADGLDAIVLAVAGLERLGEGSKISQAFSIDQMVPAVCQGVIAVQMREDDPDISRVLSRIDDKVTRLESTCERAFAQRLGADCNVPVGGCARVTQKSITMVGMLASEDCSELSKKTVKGASDDAVVLGTTLAETLLKGAAS
jgi:hydroxymethylbilane synthase